MEFKRDVFVIASVVGRLECELVQLDAMERRHPCLRFAGILAGLSFAVMQINNLRYPRVDRFLKLAGCERVVDQAPLLRALALQPFGQSRQHISAITTNLSLINQPCQTAGAW